MDLLDVRLGLGHSSRQSSGFNEDDFTEELTSKWYKVWMETVDQYKRSVKQKYMHHKDRHFISGKKISLAELYIEPVIIQNNENDGFKKICMDKLFEPKIPMHDSETVILQGSSGCGKSFIAQKILLDWASGKQYLTNFGLVFYLCCEELMCISEEMNLFELLSWSCNLTSDQISEMLMDSTCDVLFIIDGFDELRLMCQDYCMFHPFKKAPPEVIVCALLRRQICPRSTLLVTTRTEFPQCSLFKRPYRFSKSLGFAEKMIEKYFDIFFQDKERFRKAHESVKANETLFTACSVPVISWIICTVIRERFSRGANVTGDLETITSIYVDFVFTVLDHHCQGLSESVPTLMRSLGQLAERGMIENQVLFDKKTINETVQDPVNNPFLNKFLLEKTVQLKTTFRFTHFSFQEFFTALYYVLLDDEESQKKVRELLHTVERGWALSCSSVTDFSNRDSEIRSAKQLQPVILFLCGLCKNESIISFFEKHNVAVSINIETQLKEWINQCSQRYQQETMLFILRYLYELHDKSFTGKVLEGLNLIDLSNISLNSTDCCVLRFCLQCCEHIRNLKLNVTSDHLKILQSALCTCEELWLTVDDISDDVVGLISTLEKGKILNKQIVKVVKREIHPAITVSVEGNDVTCALIFSRLQSCSKLTFTCTRSDLSTIKWRHLVMPHRNINLFFQDYLLTFMESVSCWKEMHLWVLSLTDAFVTKIFSLLKGWPTLNEISIYDPDEIILMDTEFLKESFRHAGWSLTIWKNFVLIQQDKTKFTEKLKKSRREMLDCGTLAAESSSGQLADDQGKQNNPYRFVSPHAGLVFVMEGSGEMLCRIMSWDPCLLDDLGQMHPAGPLYSIGCFKGSISQLHFPHCEIHSEETKDILAVAHFTDDNVEILQPLRVTSTHVIINITELSLFGLIKKIFSPSPVRSQVLLFLQPQRTTEKMLYVHLLPVNVPVSEVWSQHKKDIYIKTTSTCDLFPEKEYSLCCQPEEIEVQPESEKFVCNFGPNYHPTFEVFLHVDTVELKMGVFDRINKSEVWRTRRILLTDSNTDIADLRTATEFVDKHKAALIERVTSVMPITDCLRDKHMIPPEMYSNINDASTNQAKMRLLFSVLDSGGPAVKAEFYRILKIKESFLVQDLESEY